MRQLANFHCIAKFTNYTLFPKIVRNVQADILLIFLHCPLHNIADIIWRF